MQKSSPDPIIKVKRVYDEPEKADGLRILVDRLWPRGLSKHKAAIDIWMKEISPSTELRKWYGRDPEKWPEFKARYAKELDANKKGVKELMATIYAHPVVTLLYGSRERNLNNATALISYIEQMISSFET